MDTGKRIQLARKKVGITQAQLGKQLGVSGAMIGQWENNIRKPKPETLKRIANELGISVAELWDEDNGDYIFNPQLTNELFAYKSAIVVVKEGKIEFIIGSYQKDYSAVEIAPLIIESLYELNIKGQDEAVRLIRELTQKDCFQRKLPTKPSEDQAVPSDSNQ